MKKRSAKVLSGVMVLMASTAALAEVRDGSCEIAIPKASSLFVDWTVRDDSLQVLSNRGYFPYNVDNYGEVSSGLYLNWGFSCRDEWYGRTCTYHASIRRKSGRKDILLGTATASSIDGAFESLPSCTTSIAEAVEAIEARRVL